jgi:cytochrome c-type biogenesis protein CcmE
MAEEINAAGSGGRTKFLIGGLMIVVAVIYLIVSSTGGAAQYYLTVDELLARDQVDSDRTYRISGAVDGDSIVYDAETLTLSFTIVNMPAELDEIEKAGGLAKVLNQVVNDPAASRLDIVYIGPMPDLLRHEAQAIVTGRLGENNVFYADEKDGLLLKCPTRYDDEIPVQAQEG